MELRTDDGLDPERGLFDLGMDSLMTVALKTRLEAAFGMSLPSTLTLDYPSVAALARYFDESLTEDAAAESKPALQHLLPAVTRRQPPVATLTDAEVTDALTAELAELTLGSA